jgi:tetratricopeptide (TPR) repeat protein
VDDARGKGNGLDGWVRGRRGVEGLQYRRFDNRFGPKQAAKLKANIRLASSRAPNELGRRLRSFTIVANIDLEPGHGGSAGELTRYTRLATWAKNSLNVSVHWRGISWVHTQLLRYPHLRPELFEDLGQALKSSYQSLAKGQEDILTALARMANSAPSAALRRLISEAKLHFERGRKLNASDEIRRAIQSLDDARRLVEDTGERLLLGRILLLLGGAKARAGSLREAIADTRRAVEVLERTRATEHLNFARGNLAVALYLAQDFDEARRLLARVLRYFGGAGNVVEVARTLQHLVELEVARANVPDAMRYARQLAKTFDTLEAFGSQAGHLSLAARGTVANVTILRATYKDPKAPRFARRALEEFKRLEQAAEKEQVRSVALQARAAQAQALALLHRTTAAEAAFDNVIGECSDDFLKIAADCEYNRAEMRAAVGDIPGARAAYRKAIRRYERAGDSASVVDAERELRKLRERRVARTRAAQPPPRGGAS